jgi:hypothetical protein
MLQCNALNLSSSLCGTLRLLCGTLCLVYCSQSDLTVSTHPPFDEVLIRPSLLARRQVRTTCVLAKSKTIAEEEVDSTCLPLTFCAASAIVCLRQVRTSPRYSRRHRRSCSGFCCQPSLLGPPLMRNLPAGFVVGAGAEPPGLHGSFIPGPIRVGGRGPLLHDLA